MPGRIAIVGLGPGDPSLRTIGTQRALDAASRIILRTAIHPGIDDLLADPRVTTCDDLYQGASSFADVYARIGDRICAAATDSDVVFAVPGHPLFGEQSVTLLRRRTQGTTITVEVLTGVSAFDAIATAIGADLLDQQVQMLDATELDAFARGEPFAGGLLDVAATKPCLVTQVYAPAVASSVKLALARIFPEDHEVVIVTAAGVGGEEALRRCRLFEIDRQPVDHLTSLWVPPLGLLDAGRSAATLHRLAGILRSPRGCPWDRDQTHSSLKSAAIEEAYEVVDAIEEGDPEHLAEELGDLLLQVALHAQIAEEAGDFAIEDVYDHVNRKLVRRHPHVFGDATAGTPAQVVATWQGIKAEERRRRGSTEPVAPPTPYDKLPKSMPVLTRLANLLADNPTALRSAETDPAPDSAGDRLLSIVEDLVRSGIDPEIELERAVRHRLAGSAGELIGRNGSKTE